MAQSQRLFAALGAFLLLTAEAPAAQRGADELDWGAAVARTAEGNPELQAARNQLEAAGFQVSASYSPFLPQITGSLGYTYSNSNASSGLILPDPNSSGTSSYSASIAATQNLFNGFIDKARMDQAKANERGQLAGYEGTRARISSDLKGAFAALKYAQAYIALTQDIIGRREANLKLVTLRFESGRENRGSLELSKAYLLQAKLDRLTADDDLNTARAGLARVLGLEDTEGLSVRGEVPVDIPPASIDAGKLAVDTPELRQAQAQEASSDAGVTVARGGFFPTLSVTATAAKTGEEWPPDRDRWSIGALLTLPLFNGGRDYFGTKAASETYKAATFTTQNTLRLEVTKLKEAHSNYVEAVQKLEVDRAFVLAATTREKISKEKYNNGLLSFEDWDLIENDLINRQKSLLQSQRDRVTSEAAWEQAKGVGAIP
jgi:outer membrane protein TolC